MLDSSLGHFWLSFSLTALPALLYPGTGAPVREVDVVPLEFDAAFYAMCQEDGEDDGAEPHFITKIGFSLCVVTVTSAFGIVSQ